MRGKEGKKGKKNKELGNGMRWEAEGIWLVIEKKEGGKGRKVVKNDRNRR